MPQTLFDRIWTRHEVACIPGGSTVLAIDRVFLHERTGASALKRMAQMGRKVRDPYGDIGWISRTQLSSRRYGLVVEDGAPLHIGAQEDSRVVVRAQTGVVLRLEGCGLDWCYGRAKGYGGWIRKTALFGVSPEEEFEED